jgi:hypothetical protein
MSTKGKGSYVVHLEQAKLPPKLIASCKPIAGTNKYKIALVHPNTKKVIIEQEIQAKDISEAMKKANELRDLPEAQNVETWYEETLFIPQPKRGKMKLKTKEVVEEEMNAETMEEEGAKVTPKASPKASKGPKVKAAKKTKTAKKGDKTKAVKAKKNINKTTKNKKKKK